MTYEIIAIEILSLRVCMFDVCIKINYFDDGAMAVLKSGLSLPYKLFLTVVENSQYSNT